MYFKVVTKVFRFHGQSSCPDSVLCVCDSECVVTLSPPDFQECFMANSSRSASDDEFELTSSLFVLKLKQFL